MVIAIIAVCYYRWVVADQCIGGCGDHAVCMDGVCVCDGENGQYLDNTFHEFF